MIAIAPTSRFLSGMRRAHCDITANVMPILLELTYRVRARRVLNHRGSMRKTLRAGRLFGLEVFVASGWVFGFVLAAWTLAELVSRALPDASIVARIAVSIGCAAGIFVALAVHGLTHALVARRAGVPVRKLTLFVVGDVTDVEREPASPRSEAVAALAAVAANVATALVVAIGIVVAGGPLPRALSDTDRLGLFGVVFSFFALANALVAGASLLPAYPLAGGRLLRAAIWRVTGDVFRATRAVAWLGQAIGFALVLAGVGLALLGSGRDGVVIGVWVALLGWFVTSAGAQGYVSATGTREAI